MKREVGMLTRRRLLSIGAAGLAAGPAFLAGRAAAQGRSRTFCSWGGALSELEKTAPRAAARGSASSSDGSAASGTSMSAMGAILARQAGRTERAELLYTAALSAIKQGDIETGRTMLHEAVDTHPQYFEEAARALETLESGETNG